MERKGNHENNMGERGKCGGRSFEVILPRGWSLFQGIHRGLRGEDKGCGRLEVRMEEEREDYEEEGGGEGGKMGRGRGVGLRRGRRRRGHEGKGRRRGC